MTKLLFKIILIILISLGSKAEIKRISEGKLDANIKIIVYESLTCSHCANFHKNVYPDLKKEFIDSGKVFVEYRSFPLNLAALNAAILAHCNNSGDTDILHFLFKNYENWVNGNTVDELNSNLKKLINEYNLNLDFDKCIGDKNLENFVLEDRIEGVRKFDVNATPTIIINGKKFNKALTIINLREYLKKLI